MSLLDTNLRQISQIVEVLKNRKSKEYGAVRLSWRSPWPGHAVRHDGHHVLVTLFVMTVIMIRSRFPWWRSSWPGHAVRRDGDRDLVTLTVVTVTVTWSRCSSWRWPWPGHAVRRDGHPDRSHCHISINDCSPARHDRGWYCQKINTPPVRKWYQFWLLNTTNFVASVSNMLSTSDE